ncbi:MAG TPA: glycosyltransferase family 4 protein [Stellaceae bacterium]|jgi:UDP-N-acetylmuramyl pentapeptide phosphotransferase/UDP-N-acetylglucosamine-1-phosphate transferase|nr:glycosyltransferase family 4 protein [Stellaceae bacterium]
MSALTSESFWGWVVVPLAVLGATVWLSAFTRDWLRRRAILDQPVERSSHATPTPRGGGIALLPVVLFAWIMLALAGLAPSGTLAIVALAAALALISWYDDLGEIAIGWRLTAHLVAATVGVTFLLGPLPVFQGLLPPLLDRIAAILLWAWFINLYNFMDGIDGITCVETVAIGGGIVLVARLAGDDADAALPALALAAGALGFLRWNWPRASIFLGDVGSVPLGFITGWLLLLLASRGAWAPALILPLYYLADATLTLLRRIARGERFWQAHRSHFYQRALAPDNDHGAVLTLVIGGNAALLLLALAAVSWPWPALVIALLAVASLLAQLARRSRRLATPPL